jgi:hypothetical protein
LVFLLLLEIEKVARGFITYGGISKPKINTRAQQQQQQRQQQQQQQQQQQR